MDVEVSFDRDEPDLIEKIGLLEDEAVAAAVEEGEPLRWTLIVEYSTYGADTPGTYWDPPESMEIEPTRAWLVNEETGRKGEEFDLRRLSKTEDDRLMNALYHAVRSDIAEAQRGAEEWAAESAYEAQFDYDGPY